MTVHSRGGFQPDSFTDFTNGRRISARFDFLLDISQNTRLHVATLFLNGHSVHTTFRCKTFQHYTTFDSVKASTVKRMFAFLLKIMLDRNLNR